MKFRNWLVAGLAALALVTACDEPQTPTPGFSADLVAPGGALSIAVTSSGSDVDPDGYVVRVDTSVTQHVDPNGVATFTGLTDGEHRVDLYGTAANCWSIGNDPRAVAVTGGLAGATQFDVGCVAEGSLYITNTTTGVDLDPDGFTVTVDGSASKPLATNDSVSFNGLSSYSTHSVALLGLASNCSLSGGNPRTATVSSGGTTPLTFTLNCAPTGSGTGTLTLATSTTGTNLDPDGYTLTIDGTTSRPIGFAATVSLTVPAGSHPVSLSGIAANCSVSGANPRTVAVPAGGGGSTTFALLCGAPPPPTVKGQGQLKMGSPTNGNFVQSFSFDIRADGTGRFTFTDWSDIHPSGQAGTITTDPAADPATSFTVYRNSSSACPDPSRGVAFTAIGREDEGILRSYSVELCDNGPPGSGSDFLSIYVPDEKYGRSGTLTSGDVTKR
jgi:hypothetical protein